MFLIFLVQVHFPATIQIFEVVYLSNIYICEKQKCFYVLEELDETFGVYLGMIYKPSNCTSLSLHICIRCLQIFISDNDVPLLQQVSQNSFVLCRSRGFSINFVPR